MRKLAVSTGTQSEMALTRLKGGLVSFIIPSFCLHLPAVGGMKRVLLKEGRDHVYKSFQSTEAFD